MHFYSSSFTIDLGKYLRSYVSRNAILTAQQRIRNEPLLTFKLLCLLVKVSERIRDFCKISIYLAVKIDCTFLASTCLKFNVVLNIDGFFS